MNIKYKSRPATKKSNKPADPRSLGPVSIAASPEALLLAAVIRQAVEDYSLSAESLTHLKRETDRKYDRVDELTEDGRLAAEFLTPEGLSKFLCDFGVSDIFHVDTILRGVQKLYGVAFPVAEHKVPLTVVDKVDGRKTGFIPRHVFLGYVYESGLMK